MNKEESDGYQGPIDVCGILNHIIPESQLVSSSFKE